MEKMKGKSGFNKEDNSIVAETSQVKIDPFLDYFLNSLVETNVRDLSELRSLKNPEYQKGEKQKVMSLFFFDDYEIGQKFDKLPIHMTVMKPLYFNGLGKEKYLKEMNDYSDVMSTEHFDGELQGEFREAVFTPNQKVLYRKVTPTNPSFYLTHAISAAMAFKYSYNDDNISEYIGTNWTPHISYNNSEERSKILSKINNSSRIDYLYIIGYDNQNKKEVIDKIKLF